MFVSHSEHEFLLPVGLVDPGAQHWRAIEFVLHVPWFLLTVAEELGEDGATLTKTWFIASERDLVCLLDSTEPSKLRGLVCMMPGWKSESKQWTSREVREVWLTSTADAAEILVFIDTNGEAFDGCLQEVHSANVVKRRELLRLKPFAS